MSDEEERTSKIRFEFKPYVLQRGTRKDLWLTSLRDRKWLQAGESSSCASTLIGGDYNTENDR